LKSQANINFLLSGGTSRVFGSPRATDSELGLTEGAFGVSSRFERADEVVHVQLGCAWPRGPHRTLDCNWTDPEHQFLWVSNLYRPEDRSSLALLPMLDRHFLNYPRQVTVVILSAEEI